MSSLETVSSSNLPAEVTSWGEQEIDASNILLPRLLLMQGLSELVSEGKAKLGDVVKNTTGEVIATKDKAVEFIPLFHVENWAISEQVGNKFEWRRTEPVTLSNRNADLEYMNQGTKWRRDRCLDFFVILSSDVAKEKKAREAIAKGEIPDVDSAVFPCYLSFRRTSIAAGKELVKAFATAKHFKIAPSAWTFKLNCKIDKNDKGTYAVFGIEKAGTTPKEYLPLCKSWYDIITSSAAKVKVHEGEEVAAEPTVVDEGKSRF